MYLPGLRQVSDRLKDFCETYYSEAKNDLATVFLDRCLDLCYTGGTTSIVLPQNWLFLVTYKNFREKLLNTESWHLIARLGSGAFDTISGEVVKAVLLVISRGIYHQDGKGQLSEPRGQISGIDASERRIPVEKAELLRIDEIKQINQKKQINNPDHIILLEGIDFSNLFGEYVEVPQGIKTGDDNYFRQYFWEHQSIANDWVKYQSTPESDKRSEFSGMQSILRWGNNGKNLARRQGEYAWGKKGLLLVKWPIYHGDTIMVIYRIAI